MIRSIMSVLVFLLLTVAPSGCASSKKKIYNEKRGLMLLENTQLGRNKGYYTKHKAKTLDRSYKKILKKRKYTN
jgi:hypothetical protein